MRLYPAIDIKDGKCVRLKQGKFDDVNVYFDDPVEVAKSFERAGASFIHLVDLDGALAGRGVNRDVISRIAETVSIPVELGGGIRTMKDLEEVFDMGVYRAIIGTKAVSEPEFISRAIAKYGAERIVVGIDAKNGMVAVAGWGEVSSVKATDLGVKMAELGVKTIIYTDISKDGMLSGPNVEQTKALSDATGIDIIASGGVSCMEDLEKIFANKIHGAIIGKAIYEKRIDLALAVDVFEGN
ncbi:MAG: 1-(5-phosphoribosyl)-5-[(5-phosphoribosylamino)methylideneamino]imidazole-4-carboxamide isomerase [Lachnospiraceae bacterium]|nr:1-(5-phosphoribosyl)-5-[(5-phosphoribosylamino)methylideneamino]imidazole-4-carboxamide isomerase [Lachnospiraceae bacterium]